jgi:hypothetical protein
LSAVVLRAIISPSAGDELLVMLKVLYSILTLRNLGGVDVGLSGDAGAVERRKGAEVGGEAKDDEELLRKRAAEEEGNTHNTRSSSTFKHHRC